MLLQSAISPSLQHHHPKLLKLSSSVCYSQSIIPPSNSNSLYLKPNKAFSSITCSISQVHSYGTTDYEKRPLVKWNVIYKKISMMVNPDLGAATVLDQWEKEGKRVSKWELSRVVKELRKYRRYRPALEVYEWMNNRGERFRLSGSDAAIQLDLISKVHGMSMAEEYFQEVPETLKDNRIYGALLNGYAHNKNKEKVETLIKEMRDKGYASHPLPFNVIMTMYMNLKEYEKVELLVSEMLQRNIQLDIYSYNIWLSSCGTQGYIEKMEQVFEQMKMDQSVNPNWTTYSTLATMYTKQGQIDKAKESLKMVESKIAGRDRVPYHYLISLYGSVGDKEEVHRVWNLYKSIFPTIPNLGYHAMISSLVRIGAIEGAEEIYEQWLSAKVTYDPRIANLLMLYYINDGKMDKAVGFINHIAEEGGKPNAGTWEILAHGHIGEGNISSALTCIREAFSAFGSKNWKPKPDFFSGFIQLCEQESDVNSKEILMGLLRDRGILGNEAYNSFNGTYNGSAISNELAKDKEESDYSKDFDDDESKETPVGQLQGSL